MTLSLVFGRGDELPAASRAVTATNGSEETMRRCEAPCVTELVRLEGGEGREIARHQRKHFRADADEPLERASRNRSWDRDEGNSCDDRHHDALPHHQVLRPRTFFESAHRSLTQVSSCWNPVLAANRISPGV